MTKKLLAIFGILALFCSTVSQVSGTFWKHHHGDKAKDESDQKGKAVTAHAPKTIVHQQHFYNQAVVPQQQPYHHARTIYQVVGVKPQQQGKSAAQPAATSPNQIWHNYQVPLKTNNNNYAAQTYQTNPAPNYYQASPTPTANSQNAAAAPSHQAGYSSYQSGSHPYQAGHSATEPKGSSGSNLAASHAYQSTQSYPYHSDMDYGWNSPSSYQHGKQYYNNFGWVAFPYGHDANHKAHYGWEVVPYKGYNYGWKKANKKPTDPAAEAPEEEYIPPPKYNKKHYYKPKKHTTTTTTTTTTTPAPEPTTTEPPSEEESEEDEHVYHGWASGGYPHVHPGTNYYKAPAHKGWTSQPKGGSHSKKSHGKGHKIHGHY